MPRSNKQNFVICIANDGYEASLEKRKLYPSIPDADAAKLGQIRIVDESGDDSLYPADWFLPVELPAATAKAVSGAA